MVAMVVMRSALPQQHWQMTRAGADHEVPSLCPLAGFRPVIEVCISSGNFGFRNAFDRGFIEIFDLADHAALQDGLKEVG